MTVRALRSSAMVLWLGALGAWAQSPQSIAPPPSGQWAKDLTGRVPGAAMAEFNRIAQAREDSGRGQLGLLVVASTHGQVPRSYATQVFNQWGIGHRPANDGILLFFALDDRKAEIVLGDGFATDTTNKTDEIMARDVVANMKRGSVGDAITQAAASLSALYDEAQPAAEAEPRELTAEEKLLQSYLDGSEPIPERSPRSWVIDLTGSLSKDETNPLDRLADAVYASNAGELFIFVTQDFADSESLAGALRRQLGRADLWVICFARGPQVTRISAPPAQQTGDIALALTHIEQNAGVATASEALRQATDDVVQVVLHGPPGPTVEELVEAHGVEAAASGGGLLFAGVGVGRRIARRRTRHCKSCGHARQLLNEQSDDPHLSAGQLAEEHAGSVDYDVWWCGRCDDALVLRYGAFFTRYSHCRRCSYRTARSRSRTLIHATYDHGGTVEVTVTCEHCHDVTQYTRHTARLERSSSSSSSSSSFGGGSSSGSGSSGSW